MAEWWNVSAESGSVLQPYIDGKLVLVGVLVGFGKNDGEKLWRKWWKPCVIYIIGPRLWDLMVLIIFMTAISPRYIRNIQRQLVYDCFVNGKQHYIYILANMYSGRLEHRGLKTAWELPTDTHHLKGGDLLHSSQWGAPNIYVSAVTDGCFVPLYNTQVIMMILSLTLSCQWTNLKKIDFISCYAITCLYLLLVASVMLWNATQWHLAS